MILDWKDLLDLYEKMQDGEVKEQLRQILEDEEILPRVKSDAIELWLENLRQMKEE